MAEGNKLWQSYFSHVDMHTTREALKLNRPDVGWYQIRKALVDRNANGNTAPIDFSPHKAAYDQLTDKLRPQVYELGSLRD